MPSSRVASRSNLAVGARLLRRLPGHLRSTLTLEEARRFVEQRRQRRAGAFLDILRRGVFGHPASPYRPLLDAAGCEMGDLERMVSSRGVEGTLRLLLEAGVYLTVDEYKGRLPVERRDISFQLSTEQIRNPLARFSVTGRTSGSRGAGTPVLIDLEYVRACGASCLLSLDSRGGTDWKKATWEVPGAGARFRLLKYASFGAPPERWFTHFPPDAQGLDPMLHRSHQALRAVAWLTGSKLPRPTLASIEDPTPMARWLSDTLRRGETPHSLSLVSSAVRLARAARAADIDVAGAQLTIGGEPITEDRLAAIEEAGLIARPRYGSMEVGPIGYPCLAPASADDVHLQDHLHAILTADESARNLGVPSRALFITTLHPAAPFIFLNTSMGDQARLRRRDCGCPMEPHGSSVHLDQITSFEKLTAAGMTFDDGEVISILDRTLPERFGGAPGSWQLLEETADGEACVKLIADPAIGPLDEDEVISAFLEALGDGSIIRPVMTRLWKEASLLTLERRPPATTGSGKIHHLHVEKGVS